MSRFLEKYQINIWIYSDSQIQGTRYQKIWRTTGQICPILSTRIWTLSPGLENNHTLKCWSGIFPTTWTYMLMFKNCQNQISVYGFMPDFKKQIGLVALGPVLGLTWRVTLLSCCILKTLRSILTCFSQVCACVCKKSQIVLLSTLDKCEVFFLNILKTKFNSVR